MRIQMFVLYVAWNTQSATEVEILEVSDNLVKLQGRIEKIAESKAKDYLKSCGCIEEIRGERFYEIKDSIEGYAKFYITEHYVELSESMMGKISIEMEKIDRTRDIENCLSDMYENGRLEPWKYEYINANPEVVEEILVMFEKYENCNISFNITMENAVEEVADKLVLDDNKLEFLWKQFGNVLIDDNESILNDFMEFNRGTHREEILDWFDTRHSKGVAYLMFGEKA